MSHLRSDQVEWVVNDIAELGVKIGDQFFFLYKGGSLVYGDDDESRAAGVALNQDTDPPTRHRWRPVFKREFGECAHPINRADYSKIGTVSPDDSDEWRDLPAGEKKPEVAKKMLDVIDPFARAMVVFDSTPREFAIDGTTDETGIREVLPRIWPTVRDLRDLYDFAVTNGWKIGHERSDR